MKKLLAIFLLALGNYSFFVGDQDSYTDLLVAVQNKDKKKVQKLASAGVNMNLHCFTNQNGEKIILQTPLQKAVVLGDISMVSLLLELGAKPYIYNDGISPLRLAVRLSDSDLSTKHQMIRMLAKAGANVNYVETVEQFLDKNGRPFKYPTCNTLLHEAIFQDSVTVALLLQLGANPNQVDNGGISTIRLVFASCYSDHISKDTKNLLQPFIKKT